jgi:uncharacterized metal-binding protein YceD (DUF177 family)
MESFKIYIDRLKAGHTERIEEEISSAFLDVHEKELSFPEPVKINGEAYLADDHLVIHLHMETKVKLPCSICNEPLTLPLVIDDFYHTEPTKELRSPVFDYTDALREAVLLQAPPFAECREGNCPERENINKYLKEASHPVTYPFQDLDKN